MLYVSNFINYLKMQVANEFLSITLKLTMLLRQRDLIGFK